MDSMYVGFTGDVLAHRLQSKLADKFQSRFRSVWEGSKVQGNAELYYKDLNDLSWSSAQTNSTVASMADLYTRFDDLGAMSADRDEERCWKVPRLNVCKSGQLVSNLLASAPRCDSSSSTTTLDATCISMDTAIQRKEELSEVAVDSETRECRLGRKRRRSKDLPVEAPKPDKMMAIESLSPGQWWQFIKDDCDCCDKDAAEEATSDEEQIVDDYNLASAIASYAVENPEKCEPRRVLEERIQLSTMQIGCLETASERSLGYDAEICLHYAKVREELIVERKVLYAELLAL